MADARVRVYLACSLDGYVAGPDDDLGWLETSARPAEELAGVTPDAVTFDQFLAEVGLMLMGRRTHDVVAGFGVWPYGELPVWVATRRPLEPAAATVRAVEGPIEQLVDEARRAAGGRDVYLDGGDLVRQALAADLVDELILTQVPVLLGGGVRLFEEGGLVGPRPVRFREHRWHAGGFVQLVVDLPR